MQNLNNTQIKISEEDFILVKNSSIFVSEFSKRFKEDWESIKKELGQPNTIKSHIDYHHEVTEASWSLTEEELNTYLRKYRQKEHIRLICIDIILKLPTHLILESLSDLASAILDVSYSFIYIRLTKKYGFPQNKEGKKQELSIFGMGKLGGKELNFSSDIDLIMAYPESGETSGDEEGKNIIPNELFFHRLAQKLIALLDRYNEFGFVYRVDMRLKPFGSVGNLCITFSSMEKYYLEHGRSWERYALIKMRPVAGDKTLGNKLLDKLSSFIYQRHVDFSALEAIDSIKQKIIEKGKEKGLKNNLKLGHGGIREIEFIVQAFQLIYGGRLRVLRQTSLKKGLTVLSEQNLLNKKLSRLLMDNYLFLRRAENAIQYYRDQQTHDLPECDNARDALMIALSEDNWDGFIKKIERIRFEVSEVFQRVFASKTIDFKKNDERSTVEFWLKCIKDKNLNFKELRDEKDLNKVNNIRYKEEEYLANQFYSFYKKVSSYGLGERYQIRLNWVLPQVIKAISKEDDPKKLTNHILSLLDSIIDKSVYLTLLVENPGVLKKILQLFMQSEWMTKFLCSHPQVLDELVHEDYEASKIDKEEIEKYLEHATEQSINNEERIKKILDFKNAQVFRIASADLQDKIKLVHVSDQISWVAESIIERTLRYAKEDLEKKHGKPQYKDINGNINEVDFGIIGYGKLGSLEMGYGSDLDLVFLHNSKGDEQITSGDRSISNEIFFAKLVQNIIGYLTTITENGKLYEVDIRLRPNGNSGMLASSLLAFQKYQEEKAWTWEKQALVKARFIAGNNRIKNDFLIIKENVLCKERDIRSLSLDVINMRKKILENKSNNDKNYFDIKNDIGGITDIEFIVQFLLLAHSNKEKNLIRCSDNLRQISALEVFEILKTSEASELREAYRSYRLKVHYLQLRNKETKVLNSDFSDERQVVKQIWEKYLEDRIYG